MVSGCTEDYRRGRAGPVSGEVEGGSELEATVGMAAGREPATGYFLIRRGHRLRATRRSLEIC